MKRINPGIHEMSRKAFLATAALGATGLLLPHAALAQEAQTVTAPFGIIFPSNIDPNSAEAAQYLWSKAVKQAELEGGKIGLNLEGNKPFTAPRTYVTGVTPQKGYWIKGLYTLVQAVASYNAYANGNIDQCYGANIQVSTGATVQWCTYNYAFIDSGQTLAVHFSCTIYLPANALSAACEFYAEFWADGSGHIGGGGPIA